MFFQWVLFLNPRNGRPHVNMCKKQFVQQIGPMDLGSSQSILRAARNEEKGAGWFLSKSLALGVLENWDG